jgi:hypothetical protein
VLCIHFPRKNKEIFSPSIHCRCRMIGCY